MKKHSLFFAVTVFILFVAFIPNCLSGAASKNTTTKKTLYVGQTYQIQQKNVSGEALWKTDNEKIAKVDKSGLVTAVKKGSAVISTEYDGITYSYKITVKNPSISHKTASLKVGEELQLSMKGTNIKSVKSSSTKVARIDKSGKITAIAEGEATIKLICENGKTYKCKVTVEKTTQSAEVPTTPFVPQTGTWQYKSTPTKGYIIVGKDDDTSDQAQFVRMVSGYGFPVTINTTYDTRDRKLVADSNTANSKYPAGSVSAFPNGCTVKELNKYIIANGLGEVAQHDLSEKTLWNSSKIDGVIDSLFDKYTSEGGKKTKSKFKKEVLSKYADTDVAQGAKRVTEIRTLLEKELEYPIYTIGAWGASGDYIVIDNINCGRLSSMNSGAQEIDRMNNYLADGVLTHNQNSMPYTIYRNSSGFNAETTLEMCELAQSELSCIELFGHLLIHNDSASDWQGLKDSLDVLAEKVADGTVEVVTRKQFAELGEYVEHPIVALTFSPRSFSYKVGDTITASDFTFKAVLDDGSEVECEKDRVVDLSAVDTSSEGTYIATLYYRGKKQTCKVNISNKPAPTFLLENKSYSGDALTRTQAICQEDFNVEAGKTYHFEFDLSMETSVSYSKHWISLEASSKNGVTPKQWSANCSEDLTLTEGMTSSHISFDMKAETTRTLDYLFRVKDVRNASIDRWKISNLYCWELTK